MYHFSGSIKVEGADRFPHALRRLPQTFPKIVFNQSDASKTIMLIEDRTLVEGAFRIEATSEAVTIYGGPFSGIIYGV